MAYYLFSEYDMKRINEQDLEFVSPKANASVFKILLNFSCKQDYSSCPFETFFEINYQPLFSFE